jgi:hypothetical protein
MAKRKGPYSNKGRPKTSAVSMRFKDSVLSMLRQGAEYHQIGYQVYIQWLVEEALKTEMSYYGWKPVKEVYTEPASKAPSATELKEITRLTRLANKRVKE